MKKRSAPEVSERLAVAVIGDHLRWEVFLRSVDYKPGWQFSMVDLVSKKGAIAVRIKLLVWDTMRKSDLTPIAVVTDYQVPEQLLGRGFDEAKASDWLRDRIHDVEMHEADEWLRIDGVQFYNPHGAPQRLGRRVEGWEWMSPAALTIAPHLKEKQ